MAASCYAAAPTSAAWDIIRKIRAGLRMHIEDSPLSEAQRKKFIEITERWWQEAADKDVRIIPYAEKRNGRWFAVAKLSDQEWTEPLD